MNGKPWRISEIAKDWWLKIREIFEN